MQIQFRSCAIATRMCRGMGLLSMEKARRFRSEDRLIPKTGNNPIRIGQTQKF